MSGLTILSDWKKNIFKPLYWLEGEEEFYIDEVMEYAEKRILSEGDAEFNLSIFYGKDANWADVLNACRRYPMFAEKQVVLLKEAQQMKDIEKLEGYIEKPLGSTVLVVSYKGKTLDGRSRISKLIKKQGEVFLSKKIYDNQLPSWTNGYVQSKGYQITPRALNLLVDHIGNDLNRIANEVEKLSIAHKRMELLKEMSRIELNESKSSYDNLALQYQESVNILEIIQKEKEELTASTNELKAQIEMQNKVTAEAEIVLLKLPAAVRALKRLDEENVLFRSATESEKEDLNKVIVELKVSLL